MKIVMEKNRTNREIREALREVYEQVAEEGKRHRRKRLRP